MFVDYYIHRSDVLPPMPECMYQYVFAANGVFVRAGRAGLAAMAPVAVTREPVRGLAVAAPYFNIARRMPAWMLEKMLLRAFDQGRKEILFYARSNPWRITIPAQVQSGGAVHPVDPYAGGPDTIMEIHSHHGMGAFFSAQDDREERSGFRIFAVLGRLDTRRPEIRVRVGIYGHFWEIPANWVFELPGFARDALQPEEAGEIEYVEVEDAA